jgi:hypothetical protein
MTDRQKRRRYFRIQKLVGVAVILFAVLTLWLGIAIEATECGMIFLAIPAGLWLIFTKDMILDFGYKLEVDNKNKQKAL